MITVFKFSFVMQYTNSYHLIKWLVDDKLIIDPLRIWYQMLLGTRLLSATVEPLYSGHHWEQTFVPYNEVSLLNSVASGIFPVGLVCVIGLLSTMWYVSELPLAVRWREGQAVLRVTALVYNDKLLTPAAMVDNLAERVDECPLNRSR